MNPQIPIEARQTVLDFITAGTSFTAYEVTIEVRRRLGTSVDVPHGAVNGIVQTMFANGEIIGYDRRADSTVQSATPPFRYYQRGGAVAAPFVAPTAPAISRSSLPPALRFSVPLNAMMRNLGVAARDLQRANGKADEPFAVWLPSFKEPTFRLRCYGAGWDESEIRARFALDLFNPGDADLLWLAPVAYADEYRIFSNLGGTQTQFLIKMDAALQTTVTKEAERNTSEPDGLEIEVAIRNRDIDPGDRALKVFRYFPVPPRIYRNGAAMAIPQSKVISEGDGWKLTDNTEPLAIVDDVAYSLLGLDAVAGLGVELTLDDVDVEPSRERLVQSDRTRAARSAAILKFKNEIAAPLNQKFESAANLWEAKILWAQTFNRSSSNNYAVQNLLGKAVAWRGIAIDSGNFNFYNYSGSMKVRQYTPSSKPNKSVDSAASYLIEADAETLIFLNDLGWGKSATSRIAELQKTTPFKMAYVFHFEDDEARVKFFREQNFDTVPTRLISELPKPAPRARATGAPSNRKPFDAQLHGIKTPNAAVAAAFAAGNDGSDADFNALKKWAQTTELNEKSWPDFKRLYKAIEARLWPPMSRFRWDKTEADFPATPIPSERDLELLGILMGRLDAINAQRGGGASAPAAPQQTIAQRALSAVSNLIGGASAATASGPSDDTLAYMKRRATKLLVFLRDHPELSAERRDALAPLVNGLLQRTECTDVNRTLPLRLKLDETEVLAHHPDAVARLWADTTLAYKIAVWSYNWLENHGQTIAVSPTQLRRFAEYADVDWTLKLAPAALQSGEPWPSGFGLKEFSRLLQGNSKGGANTPWINTAFLQRRDEIIGLFARFPQLELDKRWLRDSLSQVSDEETLDWLALWLRDRAANGELSLIAKMSPALQTRFNTAVVAAQPQGLSLEKWRELSENLALLQLLAPALRELPISSEVADFIWLLAPDKRAPILGALGDNLALLPIIEERARRLDWAFIAPLSLSQWQVFARVVGQEFPHGVGANDWAKIAELPFESGYEILPLGAGFWNYVLPLESATRAQWINRVGAERAGMEFADQSANIFEELLDSDATGLDKLGDAWLDANLKSVPLDGELIIKLAQSVVSDWQARALEHLRTSELRLPVALRLMESGLPILERVAAPYFRDENAEWSDRVLALADSAKMPARELALQLLGEFPARWTPDLLRQLAQHDDASVQAFVAERLKVAPTQVVDSKAIEAFDSAILNVRGRARQAKENVKSRAGEFDRETLLDAARNGAPRDREWALRQLVAASIAGKNVEGLEVAGAFAREAG